LSIRGTIRSTANPRARYVRSLHKRRARYRERRFIIEGQRLLTHALLGGCELALAFCTEAFADSDAGSAILDRLETGHTEVWSVSDEVLEYVADTKTPQGILAVAAMPEPDESPAHAATLTVVLDNLRDPGNLGTILRTCQATAVGAVLLSIGCVDTYSPKVVRAGMGAHFALPILPNLTWEEIGRLTRGRHCALADAGGERTPWDVDWTVPSSLIVGCEAHGAGARARELARVTVRLPMEGDTESLNAAIATAVILYEAYRERHRA